MDVINIETWDFYILGSWQHDPPSPKTVQI